MSKRYWEWAPAFHMEPDKSALLVIDMQNGFVEEGASLEVPMARAQVPTIAGLVAFCREHGIPVIFTEFCVDPVNRNPRRDFYWKLAAQRGLDISEFGRDFWSDTRDCEVISALEPRADETVIKKTAYDSFADTELEEALASRGITQLMMLGTVVNWCVDSTARTAYHRQYDVTVIADGVSAFEHAGASGEDWCRMELDLFAEGFGRVMTSDEAMAELTAAGHLAGKT